MTVPIALIAVEDFCLMLQHLVEYERALSYLLILVVETS
jgi:hypothetical protein